MKDVIYVEHSHFVTVKNDSLKFRNLITKEERYILFDDVEVLIFANQRCSLSHTVIQQCLVRQVTLLFCDERQSPIAQLTTDYGHSQRLKRLRSQINVTTRVKDRLWRKIVMAKIVNQGNCLRYIADAEEAGIELRNLSKEVTEGDRNNREAYAARRYFYTLFGEGFKRGRYDDPINSGLNYGYALIRALIRKELAFHGFEPSIGIHHESAENPYNLSDDLIEAYRPLVDVLVYENLFKTKCDAFEISEKKALLKIFFEKCVIDGGVTTVTDAIHRTVESLISCLEKNSSAKLLLPYFIEEGQ